MKIKQEYRLGNGISAMLLIFVMISIVTLGVLSFLSAKADHALTDKSVDMVREYYAASAVAQHKLRTLDNDLLAVTSMQELSAYASENEMIYEDETLFFSVEAGSGRVLNIAVRIDERFQIREVSRYSLDNEAEWAPVDIDFPIFERGSAL